ncbi:MAG TPA: tetratricopeptide repeat protein [Pyrinomonadaceae bacterium]|jgi:tetratricopeptide (TPR) repeat protein|nr:tetratricopeptide repeat protein [Pyrinomonadaceae bacterium]
MEQIALIRLRPVWARVLLALLAAVALAASWYALRWGVGDTMAEYAPVSYETNPTAAFETAEAAARLAPDDPLSHLTLARLYRVSFDPDELPRSLAEYERAASLAPNDYLIWMEMGRARASAGDAEGGVVALRRAVALAPNYAEPRWHLGNALLRAGRADEAFAELRRAADADPERYRAQAFNLAWQVFDQNMPRVIEAVGETPAARAQLVRVLVGRGRLDDAVAVWSSLSAPEKRAQAEAGEAVARSLYEQMKYRSALQVLNEAGQAGQVASLGTISNGGFESDIGQPGRQFFQWQVGPTPGAQVVLDARTAHGGRRSLRVFFNASGQVDFRNVSQVVAVEPSTRYRLTYFVRTDDLKSAATLATIVSDAASETVTLGQSAPVPSGTNDWQQAAFEFTTGAQTGAVVVRLVRVACPEESCPIYGKIWYDDFDLQRSGGRAAAH